MPRERWVGSSRGRIDIPFPKQAVEASIPQRFEEVVSQRSDHIALRHGDVTLTYGELHEASGQVASAILAKRGAAEEPVVLLLDHGIKPIIALLGVLQAGKGYVALRPGDPPARLAEIVADLEARLIVTDNQALPLALAVADHAGEILNLDQLETRSVEPVPSVVPAHSLAAIYYTSGSTGTPKGVVRDHRTLLHIAWSNTHHYQLGADDRYFDPFACGFIASAIAVFDALLNGATLCLYNPQVEPAHHLAEWLAKQRITFFHPTLTLFRQLTDHLTGQEFPDLRLVALSGENLHRQDVERFEMLFPPHCMLLHRFSSTETGIISCIRVDSQTPTTDGVIPAGYATEDKEILLLDEDQKEVARGEVGEIAVRSRYLASGYWRRPGLTEEKFLPGPEGNDQRIYLTGDLGRLRPDGCLEHVGRKDSQAKIRGYTVSAAAVEEALLGIDEIKHALVVTQQRAGETQLVAYLVPSSGTIPIATELRRALAESLPAYMIPVGFHAVEEIPLTKTGKVDRSKLPAVSRRRGEPATPYVAPRNSLEEAVAHMWCHVLDLERVGVHDNFFDLGGDSLTVMRIVARLWDTLQVELPPAAFFEAPTIADLTSRLERRGVEGEHGGAPLDRQKGEREEIEL